MVEEQVDVELLSSDLEVDLTADEREADAHLRGACRGCGAPARCSTSRSSASSDSVEEVEDVRVLEGLRGELRCGDGQGPPEVGDGPALRGRAGAGRDGSRGRPATSRAAPSARCRTCARTPRRPCRGFRTRWPQGTRATVCSTITASGQASARARMYMRFRARQPFHLRERVAQVAREPLDDLAAPADRGLSRREVAPDAPVEEHHRPVGLQRDALPRLYDASLQRVEEAPWYSAPASSRRPLSIAPGRARFRPLSAPDLPALPAPPPSSAYHPSLVYRATAVAR